MNKEISMDDLFVEKNFTSWPKWNLPDNTYLYTNEIPLLEELLKQWVDEDYAMNMIIFTRYAKTDPNNYTFGEFKDIIALLREWSSIDDATNQILKLRLQEDVLKETQNKQNEEKITIQNTTNLNLEPDIANEELSLEIHKFFTDHWLDINKRPKLEFTIKDIWIVDTLMKEYGMSKTEGINALILYKLEELEKEWELARHYEQLENLPVFNIQEDYINKKIDKYYKELEIQSEQLINENYNKQNISDNTRSELLNIFLLFILVMLIVIAFFHQKYLYNKRKTKV